MVNLKGPCEHEEVKEWCKPLVPPYLWNVRIANLNSEAIRAHLFKLCVWERKEAPQAICEWSAKIRLPLAGAQLSFAAWPISLQYMEGLIGLVI